MYPMLTEVRYRNAICPPDRKQARFTDVAGCTCKSAPAAPSAGSTSTVPTEKKVACFEQLPRRGTDGSPQSA